MANRDRHDNMKHVLVISESVWIFRIAFTFTVIIRILSISNMGKVKFKELSTVSF